MNWLKCGAICAFFAVVLGAFAAHGLKSHVSETMLAVFKTGVFYHITHSLGLLILGVLCLLPQFTAAKRWLNRAAMAMLLGILLFSGSLYAMVLTSITGLGAITPIGGVSLLLSWGLLVVAVAHAQNFAKG